MHRILNQGLRLSRSCALVVAIAVLSIGCGGSGSTTRTPPIPAATVDQPDVVDRSISTFLGRTLPDGASGTLAAARGDELVHCAGFGTSDHENQLLAGCDTVYDVMSMTKQFTAAAILKLEMMGKIDVDDPIGTYFGDVPADKGDITVHQLLTHTSGLTELIGGDYEPLTRAAMIDEAMASKLESSPGTEYLYSNVGYSLLAAIVEITSGQSYEEFLAEHVFSPAEMTSTGYVLPDWPEEQLAVEYDAAGDAHGRPNEHDWADDGPYWNLKGNGGLLSTARDMYRWHVALLGDGVLDERAKRQLFTPYVREEPGGASSYGYGWVLQDTPYGKAAGHDGGNNWSYGEIIRLLEAGDLIFWVTNQHKDAKDGYDLTKLAPTITAGVAERLVN